MLDLICGKQITCKSLVTCRITWWWFSRMWEYVNTCVPPAGSNHYPPAAVQGKSRAVQEHSASGVGTSGEAAATTDLQCLSHQEADEEGRTDGHQHRHFPRGHVWCQRQHGRTQETQAARPNSRLRQLLPGWGNSGGKYSSCWSMLFFSQKFFACNEPSWWGVKQKVNLPDLCGLLLMSAVG